MDATETSQNAPPLVLVTGGTGFLGGHCILQLLQAGYRVRTTVRSLARSDAIRAMMKAGGASPDDRLSFIEADLLSDRNWADAASGCTYVLHVASPAGLVVSGNEDDTIRPAVEGTLRVLRAAHAAGVKRIVVTSSFTAVGASPKPEAEPYTEDDWTNPDDKALSAYGKAKTLAEKAAWNFVQTEAPRLELATISPTAIFGPALGPGSSSTFEFLQSLLAGRIKGCPQFALAVVDVRDVADLHVKAMTNPAANGQRFLATSGETISLPEIAALLRTRLGPAADRVTMRTLPNWLVRLLGLFDPFMRSIAPQLGKTKLVSNLKAKRLLGWLPRPAAESILASARSLLRFDAVTRSQEQIAESSPPG